MALITGTILAATKLIGGALAKKAKTPDAKKFVNNKVADGGGGGKPGAIVKSEKASVTPTSPMVGSGVVSTPTTPKKVVKPTGKVSFSSISNQLDSMVALTSMIDTVTQKNTEGQKKASELARRSKEKQKKKDREEKSESGSGALGFLGGKAVEAGNKFGIFNFLTSILLGIGALALIDLTKKLSNGFDGLGDTFGGIITGFKLFGLTIAAIAKDLPKILKNVGKLFSKIKFGDRLAKLGKSIKGIFGKLGKEIIPGFIKKAVDAIKNGLKFTTKSGGKIAGFIGKLSNFIAKTIFDARLGLRGASKSFAPAVGKLSNIIAKTIFDARLGLRGAQKTIAPSLGKLSNFVAKRVFDAKLAFKGAQKTSAVVVGGLKKVAAPIAKQVGKLGGRLISIGKGALGIMRRVPIIGPLIVGVATYLETGKLDQSLFELTGTLIGGLLGTFIPIPVLGTLMGELVGEYVGELFYILLRGGGTAALSKKLQDDLKAALTAGQAAMGWAGDGFKRMYEGLPKRNLFGNKVPKIEWLLNPLNIVDKAKLMSKAFFSRDPMKEGKVEKKDEEKPTEVSDSPKYFEGGDGKYYANIDNWANELDIRYVGASEEEAKRSLATGVYPTNPDDKIEPVESSIGGANLETTRVMGKPVLTSAYGKMRSGGPHGGTDIAADLGAPLVPVTDATIVDYGKLSLTGAKRGDPSGWGNFIVYKDSQGYYHLYGHVLENGMKTGGSVKKGVPIAKVGSTGRSSGPHLHWEMGTSWSGGTLGGKMDPLSVYRVEDPFTVGGRMSDNSPTKEIKKSTKPEPKREDFGSGRSGAKKYAEALKAYKAEMQSQPEISPQTSPSASVSGVESQASYEQTGGGSTVVLAAPQQQSSGGGGGSSGGGGVMRVGSGDVLNSYYRAQLLGFLYKQG